MHAILKMEICCLNRILGDMVVTVFGNAFHWFIATAITLKYIESDSQIIPVKLLVDNEDTCKDYIWQQSYN